MKAIHILSTTPSGESYNPAFFEIAAMSLSAILWKKYNGELNLYTDERFYKYAYNNGLISLWDKVDYSFSQSLPAYIDWTIFWAGAKLFALQRESCPIVMLDSDLFIWQNLEPVLRNRPLVTLHREDIIECYPPKDRLLTAEGYVFPDGLDWSILPCNTAFAYFADDEFKNLYTQESIRFMTGNVAKAKDGNARMVFAEQRLLAMLAHRESISIETIIDDPFSTENKTFTHLWGAKILAQKDPVQRIRLEDAILQKIKQISEPVFNTLSRIRNNSV